MGTTAFLFITTVLLSIFAAVICIRRRCSKNAADPGPGPGFVDNVISLNTVPPKPPQVATRRETSLETIYNNHELFEL